IKGDKQEVTKIETVENEYEKPETILTVEEIILPKVDTSVIKQLRLKKTVRVKEPVEPETVIELPEQKTVLLAEKEDGTPMKTVIKTKVIKKIIGPKMEITRVQTVEEFEKEPVTKVLTRNYEKPFPQLPEETLTPVYELPEQFVTAEYVDEQGNMKTRKIKKKVIRKPIGDKEEVTELQIVQDENEKPKLTVTITEADKPDEQPREITQAVELPEQYALLDTTTSDGKVKKKKLRTKSYKQNNEVFTIQIVEDEDEPSATVYIDQKPAKDFKMRPIALEEFPEEIIEAEITEPGKKPKKKTTKTRTFKRDVSPGPEFYQIQTIEEDGQEPYSMIQVVNEDSLSDIIDIRQLDDEQIVKKITKQKPKKHRTLKEAEVTPQQITAEEKPVYITTFKSVQTEVGQATIQTESKIVTQEEGVLVEEVLSDSETIKEHEEFTPYQIEIVEVSDITDQDNKSYTITEPEDVSEDITQTQYADKHAKQKKLKPKHKTTAFNVIEEKPEEVRVEYLPEEVLEIELPTAGSSIEEPKTKLIKKRKIRSKIGEREQIIEVTTTQEPGKEEEYTVGVITNDKEPEKTKELFEGAKVTLTDMAEQLKPKEKKLKKGKPTKKVKKDELDEYIQFLIHQEIPKTVLQDYERIEVESPQKARRDSVGRPIKPLKLIPMKVESIEIKKPKRMEITSVAEFPQMIKLKTPKQRPSESKTKKQKVPFKTKLKSWINFVPYAPYNFQLKITELNTKQSCGELSRNIDEASKVLKRRTSKYIPSDIEEPYLEQLSITKEEEMPEVVEEITPIKYKRSKKLSKEEITPEGRKLKLGKGQLPITKPEMEEVILKPFDISADSIEEEGLNVQEKVVTKLRKSKPLKTMLGEKPKADLKLSSDVEEEFIPKVINVIEFEPEIIEDEQPSTEGNKKIVKKKKKIVQKTEASQYVVEIIDFPERETKEQDKLYEVSFIISEPDDSTEQKIQKRHKKVKLMKPNELEDFVAELQEHPVTSIDDNTFYDIIVKELEPEYQKETTEDEKQSLKTRKILHQRGIEESIIEIIEIEPESANQEPTYKVLVKDVEKEEIIHSKEESKPMKSKIMKKRELDTYIQQLMEAEIPKTELERYEKPEFDKRRKKLKKSKSQAPRETYVEDEEKQAKISEFEPTETMTEIRQPDKQTKTLKPAVTEVTPMEIGDFKFTMNESEQERTDKKQMESIPTYHIEHVQESKKPLPEYKINETTDQTETTIETTENEGKFVEKIKTKRKVKRQIGSKEYEVTILETQVEDQPFAEVTVNILELEPLPTTELPAIDALPKSKKITKKVKKDQLQEYLVKIFDEIPETVDALQALDKTPTMDQPCEEIPSDNIKYSMVKVLEEVCQPEPVQEEEKKPTDKKKTKKLKYDKDKEVGITEKDIPKEDDVTHDILMKRQEEQQHPEDTLNTDFSIDISEQNILKRPAKPKSIKLLKPAETHKEYTVRIEEFEPQIIVQDIIDETGEEVQKITKKRKLKKTAGPKEYSIEIVESFMANNPTADIEITTTEIGPAEGSEQVKEKNVIVKKFKKKRPQVDDKDTYIQQLIEQEVLKTKLDDFEPLEFETKQKEKPKIINKHHKKKIEIVAGAPVTVHEFNIQEIEPVKEPKPEEIDSVGEPTQIFENIPEKFAAPTKAFEDQGRPKRKEVKKAKQETVEDYPVVVEEIAKFIETIEEPTESGEITQTTITKRKLRQKSGPVEKVFEVSETALKDQTAAEVAIVEITETAPEDATSDKPDESKIIKKVKRVPKEKVQDYIIQILEEQVEPYSFDEINFAQPIAEPLKGDEQREKQRLKPKRPKLQETKAEETIKEYTVRVEELQPEVKVQNIIDETGEEIKQILTKRKLKKREGLKEYLIEIVESFVEKKPEEADVEITTTDITQKEKWPEEIQREKVIKKFKKKKAQLDEADAYIQQLIEQEIPKTELEEFTPLEFETVEKKKPKTIKKQHKKSVEICDGIPVTVHEFNIQEILPQEEITPKEIIETENEELKASTSDVADDFSVRYEINDSAPEELKNEEATDHPEKRKLRKIERAEIRTSGEQPLVIEEIEATTEIIKEPSDKENFEEKTIIKRKVKSKSGPKVQVFEIAEIIKEDQPTAEVTITEIVDKASPTEDLTIEMKKPVRKTKKVPKEQTKEFIIKVIEDFVKSDDVTATTSEEVSAVPAETDKIPEKVKKFKKKRVSIVDEPFEIPDISPSEEVLELSESPKEITDDLYKFKVNEEVAQKEIKDIAHKKIKKLKLKAPKETEEATTYAYKLTELETDERIQPEDLEVSVTEFDKQENVFDVVDDLGKTITQKVTKRKIKKQIGPKEEIIEIIEIQKEDEPIAEITVIVIEPEKISDIPELVKEKPLKSKTPKKVKKDDLQEYIQKLIEQGIPKTELEKYEKIDINEPIKLKTKPKSQVKEASKSEESVKTEEVIAESQAISVTEDNVDIPVSLNEAPKKPRKISKVKKNDLENYGQKLIEENAPKAEAETFEEIKIDESVKLKKKHPLKVKKTEESPAEEIKPEPEKVETIQDNQAASKKRTEEVFEVTIQEESKPKEAEFPEAVIKVIESQEKEKKKKPKAAKVSEEMPGEEDNIHDEQPAHIKIITEYEASEPEYKFLLKEEPEQLSKPKIKKSKEKKTEIKKEEPAGEQLFEVIVNETSPTLIEPQKMKVEVIETKTEVRETVDEDGSPTVQTITKRKLKLPQGPKEEVIEITEIKTEGQPEVDISVVETQPESEEVKPFNVKSTKKKTKKIKANDLDDYIQKLITEEIPKTELEKYEKIEFEPTPKDAKDTFEVKTEEQQLSEEKPKTKKKHESRIIEDKRVEEEPLLPVKIIEEVTPKIMKPLPVVKIIEIEPVETQVEKVFNEEDKPKQKTIQRRSLEKKVDDTAESIVHVVTIHEEDSPEVTVIVDEEPFEEPKLITEHPEQKSEPAKIKKPKKTVKKVKADELENYIQKLIEEDIPKTTLEQYEKIDIPKETEPSPIEQPKEQVIAIERKEVKKSKAPKIPTTEEILNTTLDTIYDIKVTETETPYNAPQQQIEEQHEPTQPKDTEQITPVSHKEIQPSPPTKETKPIKHKTKKQTPETSKETIMHDYQIGIIEEEPEERKPTEKIVEQKEEETRSEIKIIEEMPEALEEPHPVEFAKEEKDETPKAVEEIPKPKKKKKSIKKIDEQDLIIQKLLEQEIEKTELEKFEKIEFEKPIRARTEVAKLEPIKIERKEQKAKKVIIMDTTEIPQMVKLKAVKRKEKPIEEQTVQLPKFKLKSRIDWIEYPPDALKPVLTEIGAIKSSGELSRNIEEAEEVLKFKPYKPKKIKKIKDDLAKVELETYEKYVSDEEDVEEKTPYQKPKKPIKPEEKQEEIQIKLGKGKKKPKEEEKPESVILKKIPVKSQQVEEISEKVPTKKQEVIVKEEEPQPEEPKYKMKPLELLEFDDVEYPKEELAPLQHPEESAKDIKAPKPKYKSKPKAKLEQESNIIEIVPGEPKKPEEPIEKDVKFRIPESKAEEKSKDEIKLKHVEAPKLIPTEEVTVLTKEEERTKEKSLSPTLDIVTKEPKKPKVKKEKPKKVVSFDEKTQEFEITIQEEQCQEAPSIETPTEEVKIKEKSPKEKPIKELEIREEIFEPKRTEEIPTEYKITTTVIEPEELPEEYKVQITDIDEREVIVEEVVEERVVTRKKKPKPIVPEQYEYTVQEPVEEAPKPVEIVEEATFEIEKPDQPFVEQAAIKDLIEEPKKEEAAEEVTREKPKSKKKPQKEDETMMNITVRQPAEKIEEETVEEILEKSKSKAKLKKYEFSIKEEEVPERKLPEEIEDEKPKSETVIEKKVVEYPDYKIKTVESIVQKPVFVKEEQQPEELLITTQPKKPTEKSEEVDIKKPSLKAKGLDETEVELKPQTKQVKKRKKLEEVEPELEVRTEEVETPVPTEKKEDISVKVEVVDKKLIQAVPKEYTIKIVEEQPEMKNDVTDIQYIMKPGQLEEKPKEETEVEFVIKETKSTKDETQDTEVKIKKLKKKPRATEETELKAKTVEEMPIEQPVELLEETKPFVIDEVHKDIPKDYKFKLKEFEIPKEKITIPEEEKPIEKHEPVILERKESKPDTEYQINVIEETPRFVTEEVVEEQIEIIRKKKPKPSFVEEPEEQVILTPEKPIESVEEKIVKKKPKKSVPVEARAELEITRTEEIATDSEITEDIQSKIEEPAGEEPISYKFSITDIEPEKKIEILEEILLPTKTKKPIKEEPEEQITLTAKKPMEEVAENAIIKKRPKKPKQLDAVSIEEKIVKDEEVPQEVKVIEVDVEKVEPSTEIEQKLEEEKVIEKPKLEKPKEYKISLIETEPQTLEQLPQEIVKLPTKMKIKQPEVSEEPEVEVSLQPKLKTQEEPTETAVIKRKPKPKPKEETAAELRIKVEEETPVEPAVQVVEEIEEVEPDSAEFKLPKKPRKPKIAEEITEEKVMLKKPTITQEKEEEQITQVTLKPKKTHKLVEMEDVDVEFRIAKQKEVTQETSEETVQLKKKRKPVKVIEEDSDELIIKQELIEERVKEVIEEEIIDDVMVRRKPKKLIEPQLEELEEQEYSLSFKKPHKIVEGVEEAATVHKKRPQREQTMDEAAAELSIRREEEYTESEDVEEFIVSKKPRKKTKQVIEEEEQEFVIKKEKPRKQSTDVQEYKGVENVTIHAKRAKVQEDIEQEFKIALDSYAEEEISMSKKIKVKKPIKKTYSEEADEVKIKIVQEIEDDEGPVIEEIHEASSIEDTMYDVEEPDEYHIEELPLDEVDITLRHRKPTKPRYSVQHEDEEDFLIGIGRIKSEAVTYEEDSLTFKKKRKVVEQIYNEEGASLNITREMHVEEREEENAMYSICNYVADNDEAINLVEGEKVFVIGRHSSEWWYVKKSITLEEGWVPAQYLMEPTKYMQYIQKKLHEKIDKLPVFERPGPDEKAIAPRFIEKLQPIHTPDGYTVQFECKVEGVPRPQIAWFRETAIIKPSQDFQMYYDEDNVATLIIREVFPEDAGRFTCVAKNSVGFTSTTTELVVETPLSDHGSDATGMSRKSMSRESSLADILEGIPPTFSRKPKAQYVNENTNVILECRLVAVPEPDIIWTYNGEQIDTTKLQNVRVVTESDIHMYCSVVHISQVKKSQEGVYEVVATNREGEARLPIILKVRTGEKEPPQILEPLRNMIIREGESAVLSTQIVGNPAPKISWYKDGKPITENVRSDKDVHTLTLISPKYPEKGEYTVKAINPLGSAETNAQLTIEEAPSGNAEPPLFVERFEEQNVPQKGTIRLLAKVSGNPVPEVSWLFNNNPLYPNDRTQLKYDGENIELIIKDANPDFDSGDYKCIASNPLGKTSHGARIIVEVDEITFTKKLKSRITIEEQQLLTLECETSHVASPKWFFNGKELSGMDHRVVVEDGKIHKLVIRNTNLRDTGNYVCKVKKTETQSTVEVLPRKPEFIKPLEDYEVTEKDTAILEVEVSTDAGEVQWFKDGERITAANERIDFIKDGNIHRLLVRNASIHDEGEYSCKLDDQQCKAELTVIELPPEIVKPLETVTVTEGEDAIFETELSKGDAMVKWFKNGEELTLNERIQLSIDGKCQRLIIRKCKPNDAAEYSISVGDHKSNSKLTVEEPLVDFTLRLPDVTIATKNTDAEFTTEISKPDVEVTWYVKGKPIKPSKKYDVFVEGTIRRLVIHSIEESDAVEISCTAANVTTSTKLCVEEISTAPLIISDKQQTIKVKEDEEVALSVKYSGIPQPQAEWSTSKKVIVKTQRTVPTIDEQTASLTIKKVVSEDEGEYVVKLTNPVGEAEATVHLVITRKPSAPGTPQPLEIMHDSLTLYWKPPEDDGKTEILEYILEYQDVKTEKWTEIRQIKDTTYTLYKLQIDTEYVFRTVAVNEVGPSPPSPLSSPIHLRPQVQKEKPTVQEPLQNVVTEPSKEVTLSCIFGGIPEPKIIWKRNGQVFETSTMRYENRVAKYTIERTTIETEAEYTCVAENEMGKVETSCHVTMQEKPGIEVEEKYLIQKLRSDAKVSIPALVKGYPKPQVTWYKETNLLKTTKYLNIEITDTTTSITIERVTRKDTGRYKIVAENECGSDTVECTITVLDKPSTPKSLLIKETKKDSVTLEWEPPEDDGGMEINKYILEKCDLQKKVWMKVADFDKNTRSYVIQKLSVNCEYMFRILAVNPIGESDPTESQIITITKKDKPSPPRQPIEVSGMNDKSFTLSWETPETDGGAKILEYIVEIKEFHETEYRLLGSTNGNVPHIFVNNVEKDHAYTFKIYAKNEVGLSDALETEDKVVVSRRITPPSPPQNLRTPDITSRSVTLDWEVPAHNGGSEITGYCVEKRSSTSTKWTKVVTLNAHNLQYTVDNLKEKCEYWFRVSAENEVGLGAPAVTDTVNLKTHATVPSPPTSPLETRIIAANVHVFEWGMPESDGGAPLLGYHIAIRDMKKTMWIEVGRVPAGIQKFQIRDLQENHEYMIRIFAKNEIGLSEPLESEEPYKVITTGHLSLPDEPHTELSTCNTSSWLREHNMDADIHSYVRGKLLRRDEYFFRLSAKLPSKKKRGSK
uniref:Titin n=1 Tax=Glossina austeni TaxID=7395 RepID=A0A1A9UCU1_GLOAU